MGIPEAIADASAPLNTSPAAVVSTAFTLYPWNHAFKIIRLQVNPFTAQSDDTVLTPLL
jgi:hypothetical protein